MTEAWACACDQILQALSSNPLQAGAISFGRLQKRLLHLLAQRMDETLNKLEMDVMPQPKAEDEMHPAKKYES